MQPKVIMAEIKNLLRPLVRYLRGIVRRNILVPGRRIWGRQIPIAMITGSKGKTTTSRMLADILDIAGYTVGLASTDGVIIDGKYLNRNDDASYYGARAVLTNRSVTAAVLETARGGLIKWGLYVDRCNVAALLNVGKEQIGIDGIETVEEMTSLKQQVINAAKDAVILNADNIHCSRLIDQYAPNKLTLFSIDPENRQIHNHLLNGGKAYVIEPTEEGSTIIRRHKNSKSPSISIKDLPSSPYFS